MSFTTVSAELEPKNKLLLTKQWFDYTPEMNEILNALDKRIFNLEIALQTNNQISNHSHTMIDNTLSNSKMNIMITQNHLSEELVHNSLNSDQHSTLEKQLDKLNFSSPISLEQTLTPNQIKTRAYEFVAIFENAFDQLNIIHNTLVINDKFHYEIKYFFHILILLFRGLLVDCQTNFLTSVNNLPSKELLQLNNRLKNSQDKISKLVFIKKNFRTEKFEQLNILNSTKSKLKDHLMEEKYRSKISLRYSNDWKKNHILQWIEMLLKIENDYIKTIHQYENILKQTELTHQQTIQILIKQNDQIKLNENKWYDYYQNETSRFEKELKSFRYEFNQLKKQREDMYEEYERMKIIVNEYNQIKMNEKYFLDKQKQQEEAIKHIQSWWKGTMIRHIKQKKKK